MPFGPFYHAEDNFRWAPVFLPERLWDFGSSSEYIQVLHTTTVPDDLHLRDNDLVFTFSDGSKLLLSVQLTVFLPSLNS